MISPRKNKTIAAVNRFHYFIIFHNIFARSSIKHDPGHDWDHINLFQYYAKWMIGSNLTTKNSKKDVG